MMTGRLKHTWDQFATIWQVIAETNRDSEKTPEPYSVYDVHPYRRKEDVPQSQPSDGGFWRRIQQARIFDKEGQAAVLQSLLHPGG